MRQPYVVAPIFVMLFTLSTNSLGQSGSDNVGNSLSAPESSAGESLVDHLRNRRYQEALPALHAAVQAHPEQPKLRNTFAMVLMAAGRTDEAVFEAEAAVRLDALNPEYHETLALTLLRGGHVGRGIEQLQETIRLDPQYVRAHTALGETYSQLLRFDEAIQSFNLSLAIRETQRAQLGRAAAYYRSGRHADAVVECDAILVDDPDNHQALSYRSFAKLFLKDFDGAKLDADKALATGDKYACLAHYALGSVNASRGNLSAAIDEFDTAIQLKPDEPLFYVNRGQVRFLNGEHDLMMADLDRAIEVAGGPENLDSILKPDGWVVYRRRAAVNLLFKDRYAEAVKDATQAIDLNSSDPDCYIIRGLARRRIQEWASAIDDLTKAIEMAPDHALCLLLLADVLATTPDDSLRDGNSAKRLATKACELTEWKNPACLSRLAVACAEIGEFTDACKWQSQVIDLISVESNDDSDKFYVDWVIPTYLELQVDPEDASRRLSAYRRGVRLVTGSVVDALHGDDERTIWE